MRMFDDYDESCPQPTAQHPSRSDSKTGEDSQSETSSSDEEPTTSGRPDFPAGPKRKKVEETIFDDQRWRGSSKAAAVGSAPTSEQSLQLQIRKRLRNKFMSSKASDIFAEVDVDALRAQEQGGDTDISPEEWKKMQQEVEMLGRCTRAASAFCAAAVILLKLLNCTVCCTSLAFVCCLRKVLVLYRGVNTLPDVQQPKDTTIAQMVPLCYMHHGGTPDRDVDHAI